MYYKAPDNSLHFIAPDFAYMLPDGCVAISEEEAEALRPKPDSKGTILAQIKAMEAEQLLPRATREFMLMFMEANAPAEVLAVNPGYQAVKAFDIQIAALRSQL